LSELEDQFDFQLFVERLFQVHQAAGDGELMQFAANLAPVGQQHQGQDRSAQFDPKRAVLADRSG
jgi:hypothetical protein